MSTYLCRATSLQVGRQRVRRLMRLIGIEAIYPQKRTTIPGGPAGIFPYRLRGLAINKPNQVWSADITYVPMRRGLVILPFWVASKSRTYAAKTSICFGVIPPIPILGRSLLQNHSHSVAKSCNSPSEPNIY